VRAPAACFLLLGVFLSSFRCFIPHTSRMSSLVSGPLHFARIPVKLWNPPPWANETRAAEQMEQMEAEGIAKVAGYGAVFVFYITPCLK